MNVETPFLVYALPRSRTAWLARFLTYGGWDCGHERAPFMRSLADVREFFAHPRIGSVETAAAQGWRVLAHHVPGLRQVVIRRPVDDVVRSVLGIDLGGVATYDAAKLRKIMEYGDRCLAEIERQPGVLSITFSDLERPDACAAIFERCTGIPFNREWWKHLSGKNVQVDVPSQIRYYHEHIGGIVAFKRAMRTELRRLAYEGLIPERGRIRCQQPR